MPEVGSPHWIEALAEATAEVDAGDVVVSVLHRVDGGPAWRIAAADGAVEVRAADADEPADLTFTWQADDAAAVAAGAASPLTAFQAGRLRVGGNLDRLGEVVGLFARFPGVPA